MSTYEWESGEITLPAKAWPGFRKGLIDWWNERQLRTLRDAEKLLERVKSAGKGQRGKAREAAMRKAFMLGCGFRLKPPLGHPGSPHYDGEDEDYNRCDLMLRLLYGGRQDKGRPHLSYPLPDREPPRAEDQFAPPPWTKPRKPRKSELDLRAVSKDAAFRLGDASIVLRNKGRTVGWDVPENNHARDYARRLPMAQELFRALSRVTWTRGSGGTIVGNDEYNRDSDYDGGGANYVTQEYGPKARGRSRRR